MIRNIQHCNVYHDLSAMLAASPSASSTMGGRRTVVFGRALQCDVQLANDVASRELLVSRVHASVSLSPNGEFWLCDMGSMNGTYVRRDSTVTQLVVNMPFLLKDRDVICFGFPIVDDDESTSSYKKAVVNPHMYEFIVPTRRFEGVRVLHDTKKEALAKKTSNKRRRIDNPEDDKVKIVDDFTQMETLADSPMTCAVCQDVIVGAHVLTCGHMFCGMCLDSWIKKKAPSKDVTCPECRQPVLTPPIRCRPVDALIERCVLRRSNNDVVPADSPNQSPSSSSHSSCSTRDALRELLLQRIAAWDIVRADVESKWTKLFYNDVAKSH